VPIERRLAVACATLQLRERQGQPNAGEFVGIGIETHGACSAKGGMRER
jgi:hypothetical protein